MPTQKQLYQKDIDRELNPVISVENFDEKAVFTEIDEYVFTEEIIEGLFNIIDAIRSRKYNHDGIWINGYFGSGKSHFLKFLNYCFDPKYRDKAIEKMVNGAKEFDPITNQKSNLHIVQSEIRDLAEWLKKATVDRIIFNIEPVANKNTDEKKMFLNIFWNEFNHFRGYHKFNLALAQLFEKILDIHGKFGEFKEKIKESGHDWDNLTDAMQLAVSELDLVLEKGKEVLPSLSIDVIRKNIEHDETFLSIEAFTAELQEYLKDKDDNYRLIFLVDEVSAFINGRQNLLLQLQEIVTNLHSTCQDKIWVACTGQEDLSEVVEACQIKNVQDAIGKIMGRFQVRMSLKGTKQEYITQKRILEKNGDGEKYLSDLYTQKRTALEAQFHLPATYDSYNNKEEFVNYYPFVPYQLRLIQQVFDSFTNLGFVDSEVKGNARSIIKVTYTTAQLTKDEEIGHFISFDQFFNAMFQNVFRDKGQKALNNAAKVAEEFPNDPEFAIRVVHVLFMIANLKENDKLLFKATVSNLATLLMRDIDAQKLSLEENVSKVLKFLCEKNAIRMETDKQNDEIYLFYNDDEREVADLIKNTRIDDSFLAEKLRTEVVSYYNMTNKEPFYTRSFSIGGDIFGRKFLATNNPDSWVDFIFESNGAINAEAYALTNSEKSHLAFYLADFYEGDTGFKKEFFKYCRTCKFLETSQSSSPARTKTFATFRERANADLVKLRNMLQKALDNCAIISEHSVIASSNLAKQGKDRYKSAIKYHLNNLYPEAKLVENYSKDAAALANKIRTPIPEDTMGIGYPLGDAEHKVETHLQKKGDKVNVKDVVQAFSRPPYGWGETCTLQALNELVRSRRFEFRYNNIPRPDTRTVVENLLKNQDKFTIETAAAIPQQLVNEFIEVWKDCFNEISLGGSNDAISVFDFCKNAEKNPDTALCVIISDYNKLAQEFGDKPFVTPLKKAIEILESWEKIYDDPKTFFETVIANREEMIDLLGKCRELKNFKESNYDRYCDILNFVTTNVENFDYLEDASSSVEGVKTISTDAWPIENIRAYNKWKQELEQKINDQRESLRKELQDANTKAFDELIELATTLKLKNAPEVYLPPKDSYINTGCEKTSLAGLKSALHEVDENKSKMISVLYRKHNEEITPTKPSSSNDKPTDEQTPQRRKMVMVNIKKDITLHSGTQLRCEADVDEYLQKIKLQLMQHINSEEFTIIQ
ncbi:BREX system P-loop protein BrxC [Fibrobacter sp. UWB7]|uniref:BREX system P-loop protein BrxC n=1 Tax=Fibrobacter sp. UWB7 TaxID=1896206 RepID=UPI000919079F|nr:BREX system P-loop protein BrxC [Fibrobacter sp. UWB7]SHM74935.1 hypothetical protein SAMN05720467_2220 [Fibrobacter sp. UWB7]